jgi:hypothetical protein
MTTESNVTVRFSAKDTELVKAALQDLGESGQKLLDKLANAAEQPTGGIKALNAAAEEGKGKLHELASSLGAFGTVLSAIGPIGIGVAASIAAIGEASKITFEAFRQQAEKASVLQEVAARVGLTTDALQEMRFAALEGGVETDKLDNVLSKFGRNVGDAIEGTGTLAAVLRQYGVNVVDANKHARDQQDILFDVADAMKRAADDQERLRIAYAAFGKEGAGMVNVLRDGSEGLKDLAKEANNAGVVLNGKLVEAAKQLNDEFKKLEEIEAAATAKVLLGDADKAKENAQALEEAARRWGDIKGHILDIWNKVGPDFLKFNATIWGPASAVYDAIQHARGADWQGSANMMPQSSAAPSGPPEALHLTPAEVDKMVDSLQKEVQATDQVAAAYAKLQDGMVTINALRADGYAGTQLLNDAETALVSAYGQTVLKAGEVALKHNEVNNNLFAQIGANNKLMAAMVQGDYEYDVTAEKLKILKEGFMAPTRLLKRFRRASRPAALFDPRLPPGDHRCR